MEKEEIDELLENINELVSPFGDINIISFVDNCEFRVEFIKHSSAVTALKVLNGWIIGGNSLKVEIADDANGNQGEEGTGSKELIEADEERKMTSGIVETVDVQNADVEQYKQIDSENITTVYLKNILTLDEIIDDDELSEVLSDLSTLCGTLDLPVRRIAIEKFAYMDTLAKEMRLFQDKHVQIISTLTHSPVGMIEMYSYEVSLSIVNFLNNIVVSNQKISARSLPLLDPLQSPCRDSEPCTSTTSSDRVQYKPLGAMVLVEGLYSHEDLSAAKQDVDEWMSLRNDLVQLALDSPIISKNITDNPILHNDDDSSINETCYDRTTTAPIPTSPTTTLRQLSPEMIRRVSILCQELTLSELTGGGVEEPSSSVDMSSANNAEEGVLAAVSFGSPLLALQAMTALDGLVVGGAVVTAFLKSRPHPSLPPPDVTTGSPLRHTTAGELKENDNNLSDNSDFSFIGNGTPTSPQRGGEKPYEQALKLKKLPKHDKLSENAHAVRGGDSSSVISPISIPVIPSTANEIEDMVKVLLGKLSDFQSRALEKDPGAKSKKRIVLGLKQAITAVKTDRAKIVFVAPDTESSEALDARLQLLLQEAQSRAIPIMYCLSRRRLGKAVGSHMRQSVVTVYDADGVYDLYRKIVAFVGLEVVSKNKY